MMATTLISRTDRELDVSLAEKRQSALGNSRWGREIFASGSMDGQEIPIRSRPFQGDAN
jgi:hypothetical protein